MEKTYKIDDIYTEDAAEVLHELSDDDFINIIEKLIKRRQLLYTSKQFYTFRNELYDVIERF